MRIEHKEKMNIIRAEIGCMLLWNEDYVSYIALPLSKDIEAIAATITEVTEAEAIAAQEADREATVEELLAALEALGVSE